MPKQTYSLTPYAERFWSKVKCGAETECWPWLRWSNGRYGMMMHQLKAKVAHRRAYELTFGDIPEGLCVMHVCDNTKCCNPLHLRLGTHTDNMRDCVEKCRNNPRQGRKHPKAKLSDNIVRELRKAYAAGDNINALSKTLRVSKSTAWAAACGKTWRHVV